MSDNLKIWDAVSKPPKEALKAIKGGRLSGMTDIKPQWRYKAMTEQFGPCGIGWKYTVTKEWIEEGSENQRLCFVNVDLFYRDGDVWSEAVPGTGGSMLVTKETKGLHTSDEGFKMALTDALSVAMSRIGVAAEIYMGNWDGSKYKEPMKPEKKEETITTDIIKQYLDTCKTVKSVEDYYKENRKFIEGLFEEDNLEVTSWFANKKGDLEEMK